MNQPFSTLLRDVPMLPGPLARLYLTGLITAIALVAVVLFLRRLLGELTTPLDFLPSLAAGLLISGATWWLRRLAQAVAPTENWLRTILLAIAVITWMLVVSLTLSNASNLSILALWLPVITVEAAWRVSPRESQPRPATSTTSVIRQDDGALSPQGDVVQQLTRFRESNLETITGVARIEFAPQQQTAVLHLAFCPPLSNDPTLEVSVVDHAGISVRATECRSYGVRLEAKRGPGTSVAESVLIRFMATSAS
jgi:hypothetical protein